MKQVSFMLMPERDQCVWADCTPCVRLFQSLDPLLQGNDQMNFRLMNPKAEERNDLVFVCSHSTSGIDRGCIISYIFMEVLQLTMCQLNRAWLANSSWSMIYL